ncbi:hypothetical protein DJ021_04505 [Phenylobacterium hankyongense]|uniref:Uncharacterized protein n=1 Tax=Phenylobacterium hankyongense TaxID=1813876 RepID=A0A328AVV1_9CAUL|nr:hypothetical protein [Phenylobacterium hankyongense]RAK59113.1 hypothetical protein DJ021_04505 [Phenylobacterium hankyongense]
MATPARLAIFATLNVLVGFLAAYALTGDWRPALAVGALQALLLRIAIALQARLPAYRAAFAHRPHPPLSGFTA